MGLQKFENNKKNLQAIRDAVMTLRGRKGMLINSQDPESRSVGSFFINPILTFKEYKKLKARCEDLRLSNSVPSYPIPEQEKVKIPAAWLIEHSGFRRGLRRGGVGISKKHSLALVNYGGTTKELLTLASQIESKVKELYDIELEREAVWPLAEA